ncbi:MAG: hypothetical protein M0Z69_14540 [Actinomycetota bacterium]|nr:hypothetical protein [Actinomycetota bacterium]
MNTPRLIAEGYGARERRVVLLGALVVLASLIFSTAPALAAGGGDGCNPNRSDNFSSSPIYLRGADQEVSSSGGVEGYIDNYSPWVNNNPSEWQNGAYQWIMLTDYSSDWLQVGWYEQGGGVRGVIVQLSIGGNVAWTDRFGPSDAINTLSYYKITYDPNDTGGVWFKVYWWSPNGNGGEITSVENHNFTPTEIEQASETHNAATQFPGGANNTAYTTQVESYWPAGTSGSWHNYNGFGVQTVLNGTQDWINGTPALGAYDAAISTWDSACQN